MILLSGNGTLRTILVLLLVWQLLRLWARAKQRPQAPRGTHWARPEARTKGDVRIERATDTPGTPAASGPVEDADYEEIP